MDPIKGKGKGKKGLIKMTWERCRSLGSGQTGGKNSSELRRALLMKSKSWHGAGASSEEDKRGRKRRVAPEGCFSVYVGPQKQRFVIKTEYVNHPLFKILLEEAEFEYGYSSEGPLVLPCNVDVFVKVLVEMDSCDEDNIHQGCNFPKRCNSYRRLSSPRLLAMNNF